VYNFSRGGMTAIEYLNSFGDNSGFWKPELACQAYIMALGANDMGLVQRGEQEMGTIDDIDPTDWHNNKKSFIGCYAALIQRYRQISPDSYFFIMTMPSKGTVDERTALCDRHRELLYELSKLFPRVYVLDFRRFAPVYGDAFYRVYGLGGHLNPMGYLLTAKMVISYIDYYIRQDMRSFAQVGFINTPWRNTVDVD